MKKAPIEMAPISLLILINKFVQMLDKLKQVKKLREIQSALSKEKVEVETKGVRVVMNGKMEVEEITIDNEMENREIEREVKNAVNDCLKKVQMVAARKMQEMGGF